MGESSSTADMPDEDCDDLCDFDWPESDGDESWHFRRVCRECGYVWGSLHCIHDGAQNPCPSCGWIRSGSRNAFTMIVEPMSETGKLLSYRTWIDE